MFLGGSSGFMRRKISTYSIMVFLVTLFIFPVSYIANCIPFANEIYNIGLILSVAAIGIEYIKIRPPMNAFLVAACLFAASMIFSSVLNNVSPIRALSSMVLPLLGEIFLIECSANGKRRMSHWISTTKIVMLLYTCINTLTVILFPGALYANTNGFYVCWFLGEDNAAVRYYLLAIVLCFCDAASAQGTGKYRKKMYFAGFAVLHFVFYSFYQSIGTGMICSAIFVVLIFAANIKKIPIKLYFVAIVAAVVIIFSTNGLERLAPLFEAIGRDVTLTGRTIIWANVISLVMQKPIFGWGIREGEATAQLIAYRQVIRSAHNTYLNILFQGGLVAIAFFVVMAVLGFGRIVKCRNNKAIYYLVISIFITMVRSLVEGSDTIYLIVDFFLMYKIGTLYSRRAIIASARRKKHRYLFGRRHRVVG